MFACSATISSGPEIMRGKLEANNGAHILVLHGPGGQCAVLRRGDLDTATEECTAKSLGRSIGRGSALDTRSSRTGDIENGAIAGSTDVVGICTGQSAVRIAGRQGISQVFTGRSTMKRFCGQRRFLVPLSEESGK